MKRNECRRKERRSQLSKSKKIPMHTSNIRSSNYQSLEKIAKHTSNIKARRESGATDIITRSTTIFPLVTYPKTIASLPPCPGFSSSFSALLLPLIATGEYPNYHHPARLIVLTGLRTAFLPVNSSPMTATRTISRSGCDSSSFCGCGIAGPGACGGRDGPGSSCSGRG